MIWRTIPGLDEVQERLEMVFPRAAFDTALSNPLAAKAVTALIYTAAVVPDDVAMTEAPRLAAPRQCLWLSEEVLRGRILASERDSWYQASRRSKAAVEKLENDWGIGFRPWAGDNSREPLRDETFRLWRDHEAIRQRHDIPTTSSRGRWALSASFADLFDPGIVELALERSIDAWRNEHMTANARLRADTRRRRERAAAGIEVRLPGAGQVRTLEPGESSEILSGVIEEWAPRRLRDPEVLALSQSGDKVPDRSRLAALGINLDEGSLLPDALIVDIGPTPPVFWIVEIVASDGPITDERRRELLRWATDQRLAPEQCRFLTAFSGRNSGPAKKRLKDLAVGSYAWYADEPDRELSWRELRPDG